MDQIIAIREIEINGAATNAVNSREIHAYVKSKQDYSTWIKKRLEQLGASEGEDYLLHKFMEQLSGGGKLKHDYIVTTDIAKHLGMMERNERGKEIRDYFIEMEKRARLSPVIPFDPSDQLAVLDYAKQIVLEKKTLEYKIEEDKPKVSYAEAVVGSVEPANIRDWINSLKSDEGLSVGERKVIQFLIEKKYLYRDAKGKLKAYAEYTTKKGYFSLIPTVIATPKGNKETFHLKITGLGQLEVGNKVLDYFGGVA